MPWAFNISPQAKRRFIASTAGVLIAVVSCTVLVFYVLTPHVPKNVDLMTYDRVVGLKVVDWQGGLIGSRGGFYGKTLKLDDVPWQLKTAFIVTEDRRFYDHSGIDWWGMLRALAINTFAGEVRQGGSTITQQLAKNLFLTRERTITRKLKEAILAWEIEDQYTKDEILEIYLNRIYLGAGTYGVDAAAHVYFGKSAQQVTIAEAAMLAGLAKAPSRDAPTANLERAQARSKIVLDLMLKNNVISEPEYVHAASNPATLSDRRFSRLVNYFLDHVQSEAEPIIAQVLAAQTDDKLKPTGTVIVHTTLDPKMQALAETAITEHMNSQSEERQAEQAALVALSPTGELRAMVGGRSYQESQFNRASQAKRQPGSAFKPIVYLTAMEAGMTPDTIYIDGPVRFGRWTPANYTGHYHGPVSIARALKLSLNTVAAQVAKDVGVKNIIERAQTLGITENLTNDLTIALGTAVVTPLELTSAYVPFAASGMKPVVKTILKIENEDGTLLYEAEPEPPQRMFSNKVSAEMNFMMSQVLVSGTGRQANLGKRPAAGKTGTSQDWRDAWFMGYTGDLITGVWVGNDDNSPMNRVTGGGLPALIWKDFMTNVHEGWEFARLPGADMRPDDLMLASGESASTQQMRAYFSGLSRKFSEVQRTVPPSARRKKKRFDWW